MAIEVLCMLVYCIRLTQAWKFMPLKHHWKDRKIIIMLVCILVSFHCANIVNIKVIACIF